MSQTATRLSVLMLIFFKLLRCFRDFVAWIPSQVASFFSSLKTERTDEKVPIQGAGSG